MVHKNNTNKHLIFFVDPISVDDGGGVCAGSRTVRHSYGQVKDPDPDHQKCTSTVSSKFDEKMEKTFRGVSRSEQM